MVRCVRQAEPSGQETADGSTRAVITLGYRPSIRRIRADLGVGQAERISEGQSLTDRLDDTRPNFRFSRVGIGA